jgi:DNA replication protein DnaD
VLEMLMATELADLVAMLESPETLQFVVVEACKVAEKGGDLSGAAKKGCVVM